MLTDEDINGVKYNTAVMDTDSLIQKAAEHMVKSRYAVALTGAGISTESGIRDFRGPDGLWTKNPDAERIAYETYSVFERDHATSVASDVLGVREVANNLTVNPLPNYSDAALMHRIEDRLAGNWETYRIADRIGVKVEDGQVTLTGQVDDWAQYREAAEVTRLTDGVRSLDNQLHVADTSYPWSG